MTSRSMSARIPGRGVRVEEGEVEAEAAEEDEAGVERARAGN
jgi:hypothetical protein